MAYSKYRKLQNIWDEQAREKHLKMALELMDNYHSSKIQTVKEHYFSMAKFFEQYAHEEERRIREFSEQIL